MYEICLCCICFERQCPKYLVVFVIRLVVVKEKIKTVPEQLLMDFITSVLK